MRSPSRRLAPALLALLLMATLAPLAADAAPLSDADAAVATAAEQRAHELANAERAKRGLVKLRWDDRLGELARARATYMADTGTFSHTQAGGVNVFDLMSDAGIQWYGGGEIIAWNINTELIDSGAYAVGQWMNSPGHKAIMISKDYNYVGFGMAVSPTTGRRYWAGVYLKGPDRTGAWTKFGSVRKTVVDADTTRVRITWSGADTKLQVLTSGFRYYQVEARRDDRGWYSYGPTTATSLTRRWDRGHTYEFRVRARDKSGNWGAWRKVTIRL